MKQVLEWLQQAHSEHARELYRFIYRQIWQSLPESSRQVLIAMPLAKGGRRQDIKRSSKVDEAALSQALEQLNTRSLVEIIHSTLDEPRYDIHRLTESFLQTEIFNKWKPH
jgi:hypothetical protein